MITCRECLQQQGNTKVNERTTGKSLIIGTFHSIEKIRKSQNVSKIHKILGKSSRKSENFHISEIWTIQPKIPGRKSNGTEIPGNKFPKSWVYRHFVRLLYFWEILESHSSLEISNFSLWTRFFGRTENNYVRWVHLTTPKSLGDSEEFNFVPPPLTYYSTWQCTF